MRSPSLGHSGLLSRKRVTEIDSPALEQLRPHMSIRFWTVKSATNGFDLLFSWCSDRSSRTSMRLKTIQDVMGRL